MALLLLPPQLVRVQKERWTTHLGQEAVQAGHRPVAVVQTH